MGKTITYLLTNPIYTGDLEMGKLKTDLCKGMKAEVQKKEDRIVVQNHHEAIISHETFEKAQVIYESRREKYVKARASSDTQKNNRKSALAGLLFCGDCKRRMTTHRRTYHNKNSVTYRTYYVCPRSASYGEEDPKKDFIADNIEETVAELIRQHIRVFMDAAERMKLINNTPQADSERKALKKKEDALVLRKNKITKVLAGLYSDFTDGVFSEKEYLEVKKSYIEEMADIDECLDNVKVEKQTWDSEYEGSSTMSDAFHRYCGFEKLTKDIASVFIRKIYCYADKRLEVEYTFDRESRILSVLRKGGNRYER